MEGLVILGTLALLCSGGLLALLLPVLIISLALIRGARQQHYTSLLREQQYLQVYLHNQRMLQTWTTPQQIEP